MAQSKLAFNSLADLITRSVEKAQHEHFYIDEIQTASGFTQDENEFLFFIKPEITAPSDTIQLEQIIKIILGKIKVFGLRIRNVRVLSAKYLDKYNIIAEHYGVINRMATSPIKFFSEAAAQKFKEFYDKSIHEVNIVGGFELLNEVSGFNPETLDNYWKTLNVNKLASGVYCAKTHQNYTSTYLINGFHPRQLKHFTENGKSIVIMALSGELNWGKARSFFIGSTDPMKAEPGSIRRELLQRKTELGLTEISQAYNGVHLSAGPIEALSEQIRFISDYSDGSLIRHYTSFSFGMKLSKVFDRNPLEAFLANSNVVFNGKSQSIYDLTENIDSSKSISLLKQVVFEGK